jgi:DinB superfamily
MSKIQKIHSDFEKVYQIWETELQQCSDAQLAKKETDDSWTLGQVYVHLINSTLNFHLKQLETCVSNAENKGKSKSFKGFMAYYLLKGFPPIKIKVPPSDFYTPKVPTSRQELLDGLAKVKVEMEKAQTKFTSNLLGKTPHPAFSYLNAEEWYQLVEMHWRHHLRQKTAIENS